jgi:nicotinate-nucleotide adenylyltransferase
LCCQDESRINADANIDVGANVGAGANVDANANVCADANVGAGGHLDDISENDGKIGIFGGTFNPFHNGHLRLALQAAEELSLKKIYVMPGGTPPHKAGLPCASAVHRCNMVRLAISGHPCLELSDYEATRPGPSYSALTLTEWRKKYGSIYFIIGADSLLGLESWYHPETVLSSATIVAANRGRKPEALLMDTARHLEEKYGARIRFLHMEDVPISSSRIRELLENGQDVGGMLDTLVMQYIKDNKLYI